MFATRIDQENLAYSHQTTAAAKPLNQSTKGLESKTPGPKAPKTPFRTNKHDENAFNFGKSGLKTGGGKAKQDAFITPAGPRTRAPLGMKTTNVKGAAFQTPAPKTHGKNQEGGKSTNKPISPRLRRARVKIHTASPVAADADADSGEPDIEYMPPRSVPLPDYPDDVHELDFARIFNKETLFRDAIQHSNLLEAERQDKQLIHDSDAYEKRCLNEMMARDPMLSQTTPELMALRAELLANDRAKMSKTRSTAAAPSTLASKSAATALSSHSSATAGPRFAAPTAATKARLSSKPSPSLSAPSATHASATLASKSTLGYAKGRVVSASKRPGLSAAHRAPVVKKISEPEQAGVKRVVDLENAKGEGRDEEWERELRGMGLGSLVDDCDGRRGDDLEDLLRRGFEDGDGDLGGEEIGGLSLDDEDEDEALKEFVLGGGEE